MRSALTPTIMPPRQPAYAAHLSRKQEHIIWDIILASAINARINERCRKEGEDERAARLEGLHARSRALFESVGGDAIPKRRADLRVLTLTRNGEWKHTDEMYLGHPYPGGGLIEALLSVLHPEKFVASSAELGHNRDAARWETFLRWLGSEVTPREQTAILAFIACTVILTTSNNPCDTRPCSRIALRRRLRS
jgi:hypothetical protein